MVYCFVCCDFHTAEAMETPLEIVWLPEGPPAYRQAGPGAVLAALEVLRRAGYLVRVARPLPLPEPEMLLLPCSEAETLAAIRARPGITTGELVKAMGLARTTIKNRVKMLRRGGHVKGEGYNSGGFALLYPVGDKPIGRVRPRQQVCRGARNPTSGQSLTGVYLGPEATMRQIGICPRCKGRSLAEWLDGDTSCWICGYVVYQRALIPVVPKPESPKNARSVSRRRDNLSRPLAPS